MSDLPDGNPSGSAPDACGLAAAASPDSASQTGIGASFFLGRLEENGWEDAARLIHGSLAAWYARNLNQPDRFGADWQPFLVFPEVYGTLDAGCAVTARDAATLEMLGICFYHPRPTHVSVGIVATHPQAGGRGVARAMLEAVFSLADAENKPVRLVSSLMNLDSFSLYTRMGFIPGQVFQDLQFPPGKLPGTGPLREAIRCAEIADIPTLAALELELTGLDRTQDFEFFAGNKNEGWHTLVLAGEDGKIPGYLSSIRQGGTLMIGPGLACDEEGALALITAQLHHHAPANPVFLVPARASRLVAALYRAGARNVELHIAQVRGAGREPGGIVIPTFLPESG